MRSHVRPKYNEPSTRGRRHVIANLSSVPLRYRLRFRTLWYLPVEVLEEIDGRLQAALSLAGVAWSPGNTAGMSAAVRRALLACHPDRHAGGVPESTAGETLWEGELR